MTVIRGICDACIWGRQRCPIREAEPLITRSSCSNYQSLEEYQDRLMREMESFIGGRV